MTEGLLVCPCINIGGDVTVLQRDFFCKEKKATCKSLIANSQNLKFWGVPQKEI